MKAASRGETARHCQGWPNHNDNRELSLWLREVYHQNLLWKECSGIATPSSCWRCKRAKRSVQASISAKGLRLCEFSAKEITLLAEAELERNRERLIADAQPLPLCKTHAQNGEPINDRGLRKG